MVGKGSQGRPRALWRPLLSQFVLGLMNVSLNLRLWCCHLQAQVGRTLSSHRQLVLLHTAHTNSSGHDGAQRAQSRRPKEPKAPERPMGPTLGSMWQDVATLGNLYPWQPVGTRGTPSQPVATRGNLQQPMATEGTPLASCVLLALCDVPRGSQGYNAALQSSECLSSISD